VKTVAGMALVVFGGAALLIPMVPSIPFFLAGAALLGPDHPLVRAVTERVRRVWSGREGSR
jgi:hypothetical protein